VLPGGDGRTPETVNTDVRMRLELRAGDPFVRVALRFDNASADHRVRFQVPLAERAQSSHAEGQYAVVERGLIPEGGHGEVPLPTFPARGFVHTTGVTAMLDHVMEYEVVDGRELALTLLRSFGLVSRNANPYREDPAGPQLPVPRAQMEGPWEVGFALMPHAGTWAEAGVLEAAERYQHPMLVVHGSGEGEAIAGSGLEIEGDGVVLTALHRRGDWLEVRIVAEHDRPTTATIRGAFEDARDADILGRPGAHFAVVGGVLRVELGAWEIRTLQVLPLQRPA
jgi:alpha-mannosidase